MNILILIPVSYIMKTQFDYPLYLGIHGTPYIGCMNIVRFQEI